MVAANKISKSIKFQKNKKDFFISFFILTSFQFHSFLIIICVILKDNDKLNNIADISIIPCGSIASNDFNNQTFVILKLITAHIINTFENTIKIEINDKKNHHKNIIKAIIELFKNIFIKSWKLFSVIMFSIYFLAEFINKFFSFSVIGVIINKNIKNNV